jgi:hypothetical protein
VAPNPKAALALIQRLTALLHTDVELASLQRTARGGGERRRLLEERAELAPTSSSWRKRWTTATASRITEDIPSGDAMRPSWALLRGERLGRGRLRTARWRATS